jgi:hypothetical protein
MTAMESELEYIKEIPDDTARRITLTAILVLRNHADNPDYLADWKGFAQEVFGEVNHFYRGNFSYFQVVRVLMAVKKAL